MNELRSDPSLLEVEVLQSRHVGLVFWECDFSDVNQSSGAVVVKHLKENHKTDTFRLESESTLEMLG